MNKGIFALKTNVHKIPVQRILYYNKWHLYENILFQDFNEDNKKEEKTTYF